MKYCAACHEDLPKESYSKKQWKLDECQRRCKVCISDNREVKPIPTKQHNNDKNINEVIALDLKNVEKISDEELFKQPPATEDCPICFLLLPTFNSGRKYQTCCGKVICSGCIHAPVYDDQGNEVDNKKCPFCRVVAPYTQEEALERETTRMEAGDSMAIYNRGNYYARGIHNFPQDIDKAFELWHLAAELGDAKAYNNIGACYDNGYGVEVDKKKAFHYYELAVMKGNVAARHNLGIMEENAGNMDRSLKHHMIAVRGGDNDSLMEIQDLYSNGQATKEDYTKALRLYQAYLSEIRSSQRDKAAAADEEYRYY